MCVSYYVNLPLPSPLSKSNCQSGLRSVTLNQPESSNCWRIGMWANISQKKSNKHTLMVASEETNRKTGLTVSSLSLWQKFCCCSYLKRKVHVSWRGGLNSNCRPKSSSICQGIEYFHDSFAIPFNAFRDNCGRQTGPKILKERETDRDRETAQRGRDEDREGQRLTDGQRGPTAMK